MNPEGPEVSSFLKEVIEYVLCTVSREDLQFLLTEAQAWATFVAEAGLSREEDDALRARLKELKIHAVAHDDNMCEREKESKERFLQVFPQLKVQLEEHIVKLLELAGWADKVHKDCTISNVVADSTSIVSGVLTLFGLGLAPFTAGASLAVMATGLGLGAAAAATTVTTSIVENSNMSAIEKEASHLPSTGIGQTNLFKEISAVIREGTKDIAMTEGGVEMVYNIAKHIRALRVVHDNVRVPVQGGQLVGSSVGTLSKVMGKGAKAIGGLFTVAFLVLDVVSLVQESKDLEEGAKTESGEKLRQKAQDLETVLQELTWIYTSLQ